MKIFLSDYFLGVAIQIFSGGSLFILYSFIRLFISFNQRIHLPIIIETFVFACIYSAIWYYFWKLSIERERKYFYWKLLVITLPLVPSLFFLAQTYDPTAMIPSSFEDYRETFTLLLITLILFPIYSIVLYRFMFLNMRQMFL